MFKVTLAAILVLLSHSFLWSGELNWGIKYGLGSSTLQGEEKDYELRYDIMKTGGATNETGYLKVRSSKTNSGTSQQFGAYCSFPLAREHDSISLHTELLWHHYAFSYDFEGVLNTNQIELASAFADTLMGEIDKSLDYLTIPVLLRMNQVLSAEELQRSYQGAFVYLGPSVSILLHNGTSTKQGVNALDQDVADYVQQSNTENPGFLYESKKVESGTDKPGLLKTDFVIGGGFTLKDLFKMGVGKDEFVFDIRFTAGVHSLGDAPARNAFSLRSVMFSIGSRL